MSHTLRDYLEGRSRRAGENQFLRLVKLRIEEGDMMMIESIFEEIPSVIEKVVKNNNFEAITEAIKRGNDEVVEFVFTKFPYLIDPIIKSIDYKIIRNLISENHFKTVQLIINNHTKSVVGEIIDGDVYYNTTEDSKKGYTCTRSLAKIIKKGYFEMVKIILEKCYPTKAIEIIYSNLTIIFNSGNYKLLEDIYRKAPYTIPATIKWGKYRIIKEVIAGVNRHGISNDFVKFIFNECDYVMIEKVICGTSARDSLHNYTIFNKWGRIKVENLISERFYKLKQSTIELLYEMWKLKLIEDFKSNISKVGFTIVSENMFEQYKTCGLLKDVNF